MRRVTASRAHITGETGQEERGKARSVTPAKFGGSGRGDQDHEVKHDQGQNAPTRRPARAFRYPHLALEG